MKKYSEFLETKQDSIQETGFECGELNKHLFDYQKEIVKWSLKKGRAAIFADCGMGKTIMQLSWADEVVKKENKPVLILAPLAVSDQTIKEGERFGIEVLKYDGKLENKIYITNYEQLHNVEGEFAGIVLDESSILKSFTGKIRNEIIDRFDRMKYKLACSATPSPNDYTEIGNHCEFLNICTMQEMLAMYFINDVTGKKNGAGTGGWRLKGHATDKFWKFMASWGVMIKKPSDLGFSDEGFVLLELKIHNHIIKTNNNNEDQLFVMPAQGLNESRKARKESMDDRVAKTIEIMKEKPN